MASHLTFVVSRLIRYLAFTSKRAEKYRPKTIFKLKTGKLQHRNTVRSIEQFI